MRITIANEASPGLVDEDYAVVGQCWAAVLDGATAPAHLDSGCVHDVAWLVRNLAGNLARTLAVDLDVSLPDALAGAIGATCAAHESTCDLANPDSPSSTVSVVRWHGDQVEYLTLADSPILFDVGEEVRLVVDDRTAHLTDYSYAGVSAARNSPGGFYVASTAPSAAYEAVTGSLPAADVRAALLLTDGASRLVDYFKQLTWSELYGLAVAEGPAAVIAATRAAERSGAGPADGRRRKLHDDATAVLMEATRP